ncbi:DMT family transporter [Rhizobium sp. TH2]|uniref:DMT family transporter n=1 Tax=Rhizobium sp. TH2 TaxID=2775403 RepID=UPI0021573702|nr:DMT family transporter [Rhizobium sp. TH2]UVC11030.1 DMT family transporter [Rhizobium sp. TH2]
MRLNSDNIKAAAIATASYGIFVGSDTVVKLQSEGHPLSQTIFMVSGMACVFMALFCIVTRNPRRLIPIYPRFVITRGLILATNTAMFYYSISLIPLADAYVLAFTGPIFVALLAFLVLGERLSVLATIGVVLGFVGVVIATRPAGGSFGLGHAAAVGSAVLFSITLLMLRRVHHAESDLALAFVPLVIMAGVAFLIALSTGSIIPVALDAFLVFALGGFCQFIANILLVRAFRLGTASVVAPSQYSQIFWGSLIGYLVFGATIDIYTVIGAVVIIGSGLLVLR